MPAFFVYIFGCSCDGVEPALKFPYIDKQMPGVAAPG